MILKYTTILIFTMISETLTVTLPPYNCICQSATNPIDCAYLKYNQCFWADGLCRDILCSDVVNATYTSCGALNACSLNNNGTCSTFTTCSDYSVVNATNCYNVNSINSYCAPSTTPTSGKYQCINAPSSAPDCTSGTQKTCSSLTTSSGSCAWNSVACVAYAPTQCSDITVFGSAKCTLPTCMWISNACVPATCPNANPCTSVSNFQRTNVTACQLSGTTCMEAPLSVFTIQNCALATAGSAIWLQSQICGICSYSALISLFVYTLL